MEKKPEIYRIARFQRKGRSELRERDKSLGGTSSQRFERSDEAPVFGHQMEREETISIVFVDVENFWAAVVAWR